MRRRLMDRLKRPFKYRLCLGSRSVMDWDGLYTGDEEIEYSDIRKGVGNIGFAIGNTRHMEFGLLPDYDKVLLLEEVIDGLDEATQFWIDDLESPEPDYVVKRILISQTDICRVELSKVVR